MKQDLVRSGPDRGDATVHARTLADGELVYFLKYVRRRLTGAPAEHETAYASALATLELEAARRGIQLRGVREPLPPTIAARHLERAIAAGDLNAVRRMLRWQNAEGFWRAYRYALSLAEPAARAWLLERILWAVDVRLYGVPTARRRRRKAVRSLRRLSAERKVQRLKGVLSFMFSQHFGLREGRRS